jgi:hypothetical protein
VARWVFRRGGPEAGSVGVGRGWRGRSWECVDVETEGACCCGTVVRDGFVELFEVLELFDE